MSIDVVLGTCHVCGKQNVSLTRKFFFYPIDCECCNNSHVEFVDHCADCIPKEPEELKITFNTDDINSGRVKISRMR